MEEMDYPLEELIPLVAGLAEGYTGYEHSSITYEKAEMLMGAVLYCINECRMQGGDQVSAGRMPAKEAYRIGQKIVIQKVKKLHRLYNDLILDFRDHGLECLRDTIVKGMPQFLQRYDVRYAPQETLLILDYPILENLGTMSGIDAVLTYVECICKEQRSLREYDDIYILETLRAYHPEYEILVENISSIIAAAGAERPSSVDIVF